MTSLTQVTSTVWDSINCHVQYWTKESRGPIPFTPFITSSYRKAPITFWNMVTKQLQFTAISDPPREEPHEDWLYIQFKDWEWIHNKLCILDVWSQISPLGIAASDTQQNESRWLFLHCKIVLLEFAQGPRLPLVLISEYQWCFNEFSHELPISFLEIASLGWFLWGTNLLNKHIYMWENEVVYYYSRDFTILLFSKSFPGLKKKIFLFSSGFLSLWDPWWSHKALNAWNKAEIQSSEILWII